MERAPTTGRFWRQMEKWFFEKKFFAMVANIKAYLTRYPQEKLTSRQTMLIHLAFQGASRVRRAFITAYQSRIPHALKRGRLAKAEEMRDQLLVEERKLERDSISALHFFNRLKKAFSGLDKENLAVYNQLISDHFRYLAAASKIQYVKFWLLLAQSNALEAWRYAASLPLDNDIRTATLVNFAIILGLNQSVEDGLGLLKDNYHRLHDFCCTSPESSRIERAKRMMTDLNKIATVFEKNVVRERSRKWVNEKRS